MRADCPIAFKTRDGVRRRGLFERRVDAAILANTGASWHVVDGLDADGKADIAFQNDTARLQSG